MRFIRDSPLIYISWADRTDSIVQQNLCRLPEALQTTNLCFFFWSGPNSKNTKHIITRFKMPEAVDHYLFIYQELSLLSSLSNEAKIRLTLSAQPWNRIRSN